jgi:type I protein arginine methyltransferase
MNRDSYSLDVFGRMIGDTVRMRAYEAAISRAVRFGEVVLDLGCGPGIMAILACRAGARKVYAIDTNPIVELGRQFAAANGFSERVDFLQGDSRYIELPERVNVIVSDIRGWLPLYAQAIPTLDDARKRFLHEGGRMIPARDTLMCAVVEAHEQYQMLTEPWQWGGLDLSASIPIVLNSMYRVRDGSPDFLSLPQSWFVLDYSRDREGPAVGRVTLPALRDGIGHGLILWFETILFQDIGFSSGSGTGDANIYGRVFLPWQEPVSLFPGDEVHVELRASPVGSDYIWRWNSSIPARAGRKEITFRQSTFDGGAFFPASLRKRASDFTPELSAEGQADLFLLQSMNGQATLQQIAELAACHFPQVFPTTQVAFDRAASLAEKLAR